MAGSGGLRLLRTRTLFCLLVEILLCLVVIAYGADITSTPRTYYAENGGAINIMNNVTATDRGISRATSPSGSANALCEFNVTFTGTPGLANTTITANDFVYTVQVGTKTNTPRSTCFMVTLRMVLANGDSFTGVIRIATGPLVTENQTIDCQFDIGLNLPVSPYSFIVTVQ